MQRLHYASARQYRGLRGQAIRDVVLAVRSDAPLEKS
jgi:hypothetical protein